MPGHGPRTLASNQTQVTLLTRWLRWSLRWGLFALWQSALAIAATDGFNQNELAFHQFDEGCALRSAAR
jgi:hypothetical protein